jgi:hypothetical protein
MRGLNLFQLLRNPLPQRLHFFCLSCDRYSRCGRAERDVCGLQDLFAKLSMSLEAFD